MFPQGIYGNPLRPFQLCHREFFLENTPLEEDPTRPYTLDEQNQLGRLGAIETAIIEIRDMLSHCMPRGCPFVIGGGFVRDGIFGAPIGDIDIWLPSNMIADSDWEAFISTMNRHQTEIVGGNPFTNTSVVFNRPDGMDGEYRDLVNHWVIQTTIAPQTYNPSYTYQIQFMRTNVEWTGDTQAYFDGLLQQFDFDLCMMFLAWDYDVRFDMSPNGRHLICDRAWWGRVQDSIEVYPGYKLNPLRATTSPDRMSGRHRKMFSKYNTYYIGQMEELPSAIPVPLSQVIQLVNERSTLYAPRPMVQTQAEGVAGNPLRFTDGTEAPQQQLTFGNISPTADPVRNPE